MAIKDSLTQLGDVMLRAWHKGRLQKSYTRFSRNTDKYDNLKKKLFIQARRVFLRFLKQFPQQNLSSEELAEIRRQKEPGFNELDKLIREVSSVATLLRSNNSDETKGKDLRYVYEELINLHDFYRVLDREEKFEDLDQIAMPYAGVDLTNRMEACLVKLSKDTGLQSLYKELTAKPDRNDLEELAKKEPPPKEQIEEQEELDEQDPPEEQVEEQEELDEQDSPEGQIEEEKIDEEKIDEPKAQRDQAKEQKLEDPVETNELEPVESSQVRPVTSGQGSNSNDGLEAIETIPEAKPRIFRPAEITGREVFDGTPKFLGTVHRINKDPINASLAFQPQIEHALHFQEADLKELSSLDVLAHGQIHVELPIRNKQFKNSTEIFLPCPPGYQITHISQKDADGDNAKSPLKVKQNALGMVQVTDDKASDVTKIYYSMQRQAIDLDERTQRELKLQIAEPIRLDAHDAFIEQAKTIEEKITLIANKVFSSVSFGNELRPEQISQLNLLICNEFRQAGIASYISKNASFTQDPDAQDRIMVEPFNHTVIYFDENNEAHEFAVIPSYRSFLRPANDPREKFNAANESEDTSVFPGFQDRLVANTNTPINPNLNTPFQPQASSERENLICEHSLLRPRDFSSDQEFVSYYTLELTRGENQWQRDLDTANVVLLMKHLAEVERISGHDQSFNDHDYTSIINHVNKSDEYTNSDGKPRALRRVVNRFHFSNKSDAYKDLSKRVKDDAELRKAIRDFTFQSFNTYFDAAQYRDVDNDDMYVKYIFDNSKGRDLFKLLMNQEDLNNTSLDDLERITDNQMFISDSWSFGEIKKMTLRAVYQALINKRAQLEKEPNEQMSKLLNRTAVLIEKNFAFSVSIEDDYYGYDPILDDGFDCTPSMPPSEAYSLMENLASVNPEILESIVSSSIFSGQFSAFLNTRKHDERSKLSELILKRNPAPNLFCIQDGKIILQGDFKKRLRYNAAQRIYDARSPHGLEDMLVNLYNLGIDTKGIMSDARFEDFLNHNAKYQRAVAFNELFDLDIEDQEARLACPERILKFRPKADDEYRVKLFEEIPQFKYGSSLVIQRISRDEDYLCPIIYSELKSQYSSDDTESQRALEIIRLSKIYKLAGKRESLENPARISEDFYNRYHGELTREVSQSEIDSDNRNRFSRDLFKSLNNEDKVELIEKYSPGFLLLLRSLNLSLDNLTGEESKAKPLENAKKTIEDDIKRIAEMKQKDDPNFVDNDPLELESTVRESFDYGELEKSDSSINFLSGAYGLLSKDKQKRLEETLFSTLDEDFNETNNAITAIDNAFTEACSDNAFAQDVKLVLKNMNDLSKRLLRHQIIYDRYLKDKFNSQWQYLRWHGDPSFDTDNNPLAASPAQDLIKQELPDLSPDSLFNRIARMKTSSYVFNYKFGTNTCKALEGLLEEGDFEWSRAKSINEMLPTNRQVSLDSEPIVKSQARYGYAGVSQGKVQGSLEYDHSRQYVDGDDVFKNMDWNLFARTNKPHTKVMTDDIQLKSQEYIIDLSWLHFFQMGMSEDILNSSQGLKPFADLIQFIYQNGQKKNNQSLTITCHGEPILHLDRADIISLVNGKAIEDKYGKRTRLMDLYLSLRALATVDLSPFTLMDTPIFTKPYLPRYKNSQVHILVPGGLRSGKIKNSYKLFDQWSRQKGSEILVARQLA